MMFMMYAIFNKNIKYYGTMERRKGCEQRPLAKISSQQHFDPGRCPQSF
jgi:hypothetical protein